MTAEKEVKYAHRLPPCPDYDIEGVESWLTDLAKEGLLLDKDTQFFGFFSFIRTTPRMVTYRLEPAVKSQSFWDGDPGKPKDEAQSLYAEMGWEYITRYGDFFIYRSYDPNARELHTDPEIQADALNMLRKRQRSALIFDILIIVLYCAIGVMRFPMGLIVAMGLVQTLCFYIFMLLMLLRPAVSVWKLQKLRRKIMSGQSIHEKSDWRSSALKHRILRHVPDILFTLVIGSMLLNAFVEESQEIKLADFSGDPPFVTIADLNPDGAYEMEGLTYANRMRRWENWPFVDNWDWYEYGSIQLADGTTLSGPLDVKYHKTLSPVLAQQLARELVAYADSGKYFTKAIPLDTGFEAVTAYRYQGKYGLDTVLLICDNIVIEAQVLLDNADSASAKDLWIQLMTERLISE